MQPTTLLEAIRVYSDLDICEEALAEARWPDGVICPQCGLDRPTYLFNQRRWQCRKKHPKRQFSAKAGTVFEASTLGLDKWFAAVWLIANAKNGISSYEIHRSIGVTQKSAWFMLQRIRLAMQKKVETLSGEVEVDETFIGGKARNMHVHKRKEKITARGPSGKTVVLGMLERKGDKDHSTVVARVIEGRKKGHLQPKVTESVEEGSTVYTDELASYEGLDKEFEHKVINHAETYVRGKVHTNGMENFWSLLKRSINGTYVSVEPFHLFRYIDEQAFRFNTRTQTDGERFQTLLGMLTGRRLTYTELIGKEEEGDDREAA